VKTEEENKTFLRLREKTWIEDTGTHSSSQHNNTVRKKKKRPNSLCSSDSLQTEAWEKQVERLIDNRQVGFHTTLPTLIIKATI